MAWVMLLAVAAWLTATNGQCPGKADVIFAIPSTNQILDKEFVVFEDFLQKLLRYFVIDSKQVNIGLIKYGGVAAADSWLLPFKNRMRINTRITLATQKQTGYKNDVSSALKLMRRMFKYPAENKLVPPRAGVQKIGVIFVFGKAEPEMSQLVITEAAAAKAEGVTLYALSTGFTGPEFEQIGTNRCKLYYMKNYRSGLPSVLKQLGSSICAEMDPSVNPTVGNCLPRSYTPKSLEVIKCLPDAPRFQEPENCAYFYLCFFNIPLRAKCMPDMLYDPTVHVCQSKEFISCYSETKCPAPFGLFPYPGDCSKYLNCAHGMPYVQSCAPGMWYSVDLKACNLISKVLCPKDRNPFTLGIASPRRQW